MGWWIVLGVSALVYEILILSFNAHDSDETLGLCFFGLLALLPVGAILGGKLIGGFGWVMNGVLIGVITGLIIIGKAISNGFGIKPFAALLPFFVFGGAVLVFRYLGKHWWSTVLGVVAGGIPIYLLNIPLFIKAKAQKEKSDLIKKEIADKRKEKRRLRKEERERKWLEIKVAHITQLYNENQNKNAKKLEKLNKECLKYVEMFEGKSPDSALAKFDIQMNNTKTLFHKVGGFLEDVFTAGEGSRYGAEWKYKELTNIYKYYEAQYKVSLGNLTIVNTYYNFIREKAILYMQKIREIMAELPLKDRQVFDKLEGVNFIHGLLGDKAIQEIFISIEKMNENYRAQAEKSLDNSMNIAGGILEDTGKYLSKQMKKNKGDFSDEDLVLGGIGLAAGAAVMAAEGISQYFGSMSANNEAKTRYMESLLNLRQGIENIVKTNQPIVDDLIKRITELNHSLNESIERYIIVFNTVNSYIFPNDDMSKTKEARQKRKEEGGNYFTEDEVLKIMELREFNKWLGILVDADLYKK